MMIDEDHCIYANHLESKFVILSLYIDDIPLARNDKKFVVIIKEWWSSNFEMKDMREATYVLCVKIYRDY